MIEIVGTELYQWDTGRIVRITGTEAMQAHFANKGDSQAVVMGITETEAKIPDFLLQTGKQLCVYAVKDGITVESKIFHVKKRERPKDYVYEEDQRNYIYELIVNAEQAVSNARKAAEDANAAAGNADLSVERVNLAIGNANQSAEGANLAAKNANDSANNVNDAAKNANEAAKNANDAAEYAKEYVHNLLPPAVRMASVTLSASKWQGSGNLYYQVVSVAGATENTQVNLTPSVEQLSTFYEKDLTFITENDGGVITVYVIGQKPQNDYIIQANIVEVIV